MLSYLKAFIDGYLIKYYDRIIHFKKNRFYSISFTHRLLEGIEIINNAPLSDLRDPQKLVDIIRRIGLTYDSRGFEIYGKDSEYMLPPVNLFRAVSPDPFYVGRGGLWQIPQELAECLIYLSKEKIHSFLEIGTWQGWTSSIFVSYLLKFNKTIEALTIDPKKHFSAYRQVKKRIPLKYKKISSERLKGKMYDICFIDADHRYLAVKNDFENVGKFSRISIYHDIYDHSLGVFKFWNEIKKIKINDYDFKEFLYHSEGKDFMGIGLMKKKEQRNS